MTAGRLGSFFCILMARLNDHLRVRALDRPIKHTIEVSTSGSVRQTALQADPVVRVLRAEDGRVTRLTVPGSF